MITDFGLGDELPEYKVTAVQIAPSNGPSECSSNTRSSRTRVVVTVVEAAE